MIISLVKKEDKAGISAVVNRWCRFGTPLLVEPDDISLPEKINEIIDEKITINGNGDV